MERLASDLSVLSDAEIREVVRMAKAHRKLTIVIKNLSGNGEDKRITLYPGDAQL